MTDAVAVFIPGYRLTDSSTGEPISGATISFFDAGTTSPKTVYADRNLTVQLGTSVITDALGRPTSDGTTPTDIFVGTADYKCVIADANNVVIETKDNRPGAVVSASSVDVSVTATFPVAIKSLDYTVLQADQNTTFVGNCSSADVNFTLPSAVPGTVTQTGQVSAAGWKIKIQHGGSANHVVIKTVSSQTLSGGVASSATQLVLVRQGEEVELTSDGGNWRVSGHTQGAPHSYTTGIIQIVSRLATSPGSPTVGDKYILTGTGGSWAFFSVGDIATWVGSTWVNQTPPSNCGWRAWSKADNLYYSYISSAWAVETGTSSQSGTFKAATQSAQETATANDTAVTPGTQQSHPGHPKVWARVNVSGGTPTMATSYNMTSITDSGVGLLGLTIATDFSSANWAGSLNVDGDGDIGRLTSYAAGTVSGRCSVGSDGNADDPASWSFSGLGDQ